MKYAFKNDNSINKLFLKFYFIFSQIGSIAIYSNYAFKMCTELKHVT